MSGMNTVTIFHNPQCGTSRNTLAMIRNAGIEPQVVHYMETPPTRAELVQLIQDCGLSVREVMRDKGDLYNELQLADPKWTDDELLDFMIAHPILINRPIVVTSRGTRLCRPSEKVLEILPQPQQGPFTKEDGDVVIPAR
jgi:arsenate reductase